MAAGGGARSVVPQPSESKQPVPSGSIDFISHIKNLQNRLKIHEKHLETDSRNLHTAQQELTTLHNEDDIAYQEAYIRDIEIRLQKLSADISELKLQIGGLQTVLESLSAAPPPVTSAAVSSFFHTIASHRLGSIQVNVMLLPGVADGFAVTKMFKTRVEPAHTISVLKAEIFAIANVEIHEQRLFFWGQLLKDSSTFEGNNIQNNSILHLVPPDLGRLLSPSFTGKGSKPISDDPSNLQLRVVKAVARLVFTQSLSQSATAEALWKKKQKVLQGGSSKEEFHCLREEIARTMEDIQEKGLRWYIQDQSAHAVISDDDLEKKVKPKFSLLLLRSKKAKVNFCVDHPSKLTILLWFRYVQPQLRREFLPLMFCDKITSEWNKANNNVVSQNASSVRRQDMRSNLDVVFSPSVFPPPSRAFQQLHPAVPTQEAVDANEQFKLKVSLFNNDNGFCSVKRGNDVYFEEGPLTLWSYRLLEDILKNDETVPFAYFSDELWHFLEDKYCKDEVAFMQDFFGEEWLFDLRRMSATRSTEHGNFPQMELRREEVVWIRAGVGDCSKEWVSMSEKEALFLETWYRDPAAIPAPASDDFIGLESCFGGSQSDIEQKLKIVASCAASRDCVHLSIARLPFPSYEFFAHRKVCTSFRGDVLYQCALWPQYLLMDLDENMQNCCVPPLDPKDLVKNVWNAIRSAHSLVSDKRSTRCFDCNPVFMDKVHTCPGETAIYESHSPCVWGCSFCLHRNNFSSILRCVFERIRPAVEMCFRKCSDEVCQLLKQELLYEQDNNFCHFDMYHHDEYQLCNQHFPKNLDDENLDQFLDEEGDDYLDDISESDRSSVGRASQEHSCSSPYICAWVDRFSQFHRRPCRSIPWFASKIKRWPLSDGPDQIGKLFCNCYSPSQGFFHLFLRNIDTANLCNAIVNCRHFEEKWFKHSWVKVQNEVNQVRGIRNKSLSHTTKMSFVCKEFSEHAKSVFALMKSFGEVIVGQYPQIYFSLKAQIQNASVDSIADVKLENIRTRFNELHSHVIDDWGTWKNSPRDHCVIAQNFCCERLMTIRGRQASEMAEAGTDDTRWYAARDRGNEQSGPFERLKLLIDEYLENWDANRCFEDFEKSWKFKVSFSCQTYYLCTDLIGQFQVYLKSSLSPCAHNS
jgi:hypothetical protein